MLVSTPSASRVYIDPCLHCKAMVLAAVLAVTEFFGDTPLMHSLPAVVCIPVQPDGACFWSCMWLACAASDREKFLWYHRPRSAQGYPESPEARLEEDRLVSEWALNLDGGNVPSEIKKRIRGKENATNEDIDPWKKIQCIR